MNSSAHICCPKCRKAELVPQGKFRWRCPYIGGKEEFEDDEELGKSEDVVLDGRMCGFQCGISFFFDDENISWKLELGVPIGELKLSQRAVELIRTGVLALDDLERAVRIEKLESVISAQQREDDLEEIKAIMNDVVGRSAGIHRQLTSGDSYRKYKSGGLVAAKLGGMV
jgi:hypothetical protein